MIDDGAINVMLLNALAPVGPVMTAALTVAAVLGVVVTIMDLLYGARALVALRNTRATGDQQGAGEHRSALMWAGLLAVLAPAMTVFIVATGLGPF